MKKIALALLILVTLAACQDKNKDKNIVTPKQYSTWIVNGIDTFKTDNVDSEIAWNPIHTFGGASIMSNDSINWFRLSFRLDYFPDNGIWQIGDSSIEYTGNPNYSYLSFYYNNVFYVISSYETSYLNANLNNDQISYGLNPTWFVNYYNPNDSISIQGTFFLP